MLKFLFLSLLVLASCNSRDLSAAKPKGLTEVNSKVNSYTYLSDQDQFGIPDYWQVPLKFLYTTKQGDCEDYAIAKAFLLDNLNYVEAENIELVVTRSKLGLPNHMVVLINGYWVLDNNYEDVYPLHKLLLNDVIIGREKYDVFKRSLDEARKNLLQ